MGPSNTPELPEEGSKRKTMAEYLASPSALKALYAGNALWFTSAFIHFAFKQPGIMRKYSKRKHSTDPLVRKLAKGDPWHHDIMAYLGYMNTSLAALALLRLYALCKLTKWASPSPAAGALSTGSLKGDIPLDVTALVVLGLGNASQAYGNFAGAIRHGRWIMGSGFDIITVLDALFTVLDGLAAMGRVARL